MEKSFKYKALAVRSFVDLTVRLKDVDTLAFEFISDEDFQLVIKNCGIDDDEVSELNKGFASMYDAFKELTNMEEIFKKEYKYKPADTSIVNQVKFRLNNIVNGLSVEMGVFINTTEFAKFLFDAYVLGNEMYLKIIKKYLFQKEHKVDINFGPISSFSMYGVAPIPKGLSAYKPAFIGGNINGKEK